MILPLPTLSYDREVLRCGWVGLRASKSVDFNICICIMKERVAFAQDGMQMHIINPFIMHPKNFKGCSGWGPWSTT